MLVLRKSYTLPGFPATGKESRVTTETNQVAREVGRKDIATRFAVVEASDLIHSFDPRYPQALQPKRERRPGVVDPQTELTVEHLIRHMDFASLMDSRQASCGAPIIDDANHSISGSARIEAFKRMYRHEGQQAADYKQFLIDEAVSLGLDADKIAAMSQPVLVRVITTPLAQDQLAAFAEEANQRHTQTSGSIALVVKSATPHPPYLVLRRSYVPSHKRSHASGETVTVAPYFTKIVPKGEEDTAPPRQRPVLRNPVNTVSPDLTPEKLARTMLRHVESGRLSVEDAYANLAHLEQCANAGEDLTHGPGVRWNPEETKAFLRHTASLLVAHAARKQEEADAQRKTADEAPPPAQKSQIKRPVVRRQRPPEAAHEATR